MGLDVHLYPKDRHEQNERHDVEWTALYERKERGEITQAEYDELRKTITQYASHDDVPSERYPEHFFNRRYLRSSYNGGGFNRAVPDFVGADHGLYWIFEPMGREWDGDDGGLAPDDVPKLRESAERARRVAQELRDCEPLRVDCATALLGPMDHHCWSSPPTDDQVLAWYRAEKAKRAEGNASFDSYSSAKGTVYGFGEGIEVLAATVGRDAIGQPAAVLVYRPSKESVTFYVEAAEITAEFCEEAVSLIERDGEAYLSWSG